MEILIIVILISLLIGFIYLVIKEITNRKSNSKINITRLNWLVEDYQSKVTMIDETTGKKYTTQTLLSFYRAKMIANCADYDQKLSINTKRIYIGVNGNWIILVTFKYKGNKRTFELEIRS